jgi:hypothetical protein
MRRLPLIVAALAFPAMAGATPEPAPSPLPPGGDQELPKVLYVVPWKEIAVERSMPPPQTGSREALLAPLDREVVRRQLRRREAGSPEQSGDVRPPPGGN